MINKKYIEFIPSMEGAEELLDQVESVSKDIDLLKSCIENEVTFFSLLINNSMSILNKKSDCGFNLTRETNVCIYRFSRTFMML